MVRSKAVRFSISLIGRLFISAFQALPHLEMTAGLWIKAGRLSSQLHKKGQSFPLSDVIIASLALEYGYSLLTVDRHFEAVPGLAIIKISSWS